MNEEQRMMTPSNDLGLDFGPNEEYVDPHLKSQRDYGSDYAKLAMQGGHRDLLMMDNNDETDTSRKQKGCENISDYNQMARQGGQKDLLRMDSEREDNSGRKQKGNDNVSDYNRIAMQGGHRDLLVIEENKPSTKQSNSHTDGDWFSHRNVSPKNKSKSTPSSTIQSAPQPSPAKLCKPRVISSSVIGDHDITPVKVGKKRFDQSNQKREAPFATFGN